MKRNIGSVLALYPMPVVVVGTMINQKPNWLLVAHVGIIGHDRIMISCAKQHYTPVLFDMPNYEYIRTGDVIGGCLRLDK